MNRRAAAQRHPGSRGPFVSRFSGLNARAPPLEQEFSRSATVVVRRKSTGAARVERATVGFKVRCSAIERRAFRPCNSMRGSTVRFHRRGTDRTCNLRSQSPTLCRLSYAPIDAAPIEPIVRFRRGVRGIARQAPGRPSGCRGVTREGNSGWVIEQVVWLIRLHLFDEKRAAQVQCDVVAEAYSACCCTCCCTCCWNKAFICMPTRYGEIVLPIILRSMRRGSAKTSEFPHFSSRAPGYCPKALERSAVIL